VASAVAVALTRAESRARRGTRALCAPTWRLCAPFARARRAKTRPAHGAAAVAVCIAICVPLSWDTIRRSGVADRDREKRVSHIF
jgi:hypothetical protein